MILFSGLLGFIITSETFLSLIWLVVSSATSGSTILGIFLVLSIGVGEQLKKDIKEINKKIFLI